MTTLFEQLFGLADVEKDLIDLKEGNRKSGMKSISSNGTIGDVDFSPSKIKQDFNQKDKKQKRNFYSKTKIGDLISDEMKQKIGSSIVVDDLKKNSKKEISKKISQINVLKDHIFSIAKDKQFLNKKDHIKNMAIFFSNLKKNEQEDILNIQDFDFLECLYKTDINNLKNIFEFNLEDIYSVFKRILESLGNDTIKTQKIFNNILKNKNFDKVLENIFNSDSFLKTILHNFLESFVNNSKLLLEDTEQDEERASDYNKIHLNAIKNTTNIDSKKIENNEILQKCFLSSIEDLSQKSIEQINNNYNFIDLVLSTNDDNFKEKFKDFDVEDLLKIKNYLKQGQAIAKILNKNGNSYDWIKTKGLYDDLFNKLSDEFDASTADVILDKITEFSPKPKENTSIQNNKYEDEEKTKEDFDTEEQFRKEKREKNKDIKDKNTSFRDKNKDFFITNKTTSKQDALNSHFIRLKKQIVNNFSNGNKRNAKFMEELDYTLPSVYAKTFIRNEIDISLETNVIEIIKKLLSNNVSDYVIFKYLADDRKEIQNYFQNGFLKDDISHSIRKMYDDFINFEIQVSNKSFIKSFSDMFLYLNKNIYFEGNENITNELGNNKEKINIDDDKKTLRNITNIKKLYLASSENIKEYTNEFVLIFCDILNLLCKEEKTFNDIINEYDKNFFRIIFEEATRKNTIDGEYSLLKKQKNENGITLTFKDYFNNNFDVFAKLLNEIIINEKDENTMYDLIDYLEAVSDLHKYSLENANFENLLYEKSISKSQKRLSKGIEIPEIHTPNIGLKFKPNKYNKDKTFEKFKKQYKDELSKINNNNDDTTRE